MLFNRREIKKKALRALRRHYLIFALVCLIAGFCGVKGGSTPGGRNTAGAGRAAESGTLVESGTTAVAGGLSSSVYGSSVEKLLGGLADRALLDAGLKKEEVLGRSRGVLAMIVNAVSSGAILTTLASGIVSFAGSESAALAIVIGLSILLVLFVWFYAANTYAVISARIFLEGRVYEKVPAGRFLFFVHLHKWTNVALIMLRTAVCQILWWLTIVGGVIKGYSYRMVPYIAAENPSVSPKEAIALSRRMMDGHKWECFKIDLSLLGWTVLNILTLGLSGTLFSNPYREAIYAEYYAYVRRMARERRISGSILLNDDCLFARADEKTLLLAYQKEMSALKQPLPDAPGGFGGLIADTFGVVLVSGKKEREYEKGRALRETYLSMQDEMEGKAYPTRLSPVPEAARHSAPHTLGCERNYSVCSMILLFFSFAFIGWIWEVSLHLITDGEFVNRGVLHGPWLPIYGTGGVLILLILRKLRSRPALEFLMAVVLSGCVEYFTAWQLEVTHGGQKWWDYSGYFLNLHGRICAEGLLVFGLGGMAVVYLAAPLLDDLFQKIRLRVLIPVCAVLLVLYCADQMYSSKHPNTGKGITDYAWESAACEDVCLRDPAGKSLNFLVDK